MEDLQTTPEKPQADLPLAVGITALSKNAEPVLTVEDWEQWVNHEMPQTD